MECGVGLAGRGAPGQARNAEPLHRQISSLLPDLRGFARFLTRDAAAADDLVQDTLVRALAAQAQFEDGTNLKAWLFTIQRNAFYEQARRRRREMQMLNARLAEPENMTPPDAALRGDVADLQRMLFMLPPLLREALVLVGAQELSYEQAAAVCGVPVGTIKARVSRARTRLSQARLSQAPHPPIPC